MTTSTPRRWRSFVRNLPDQRELLVLEWQHTAYGFRPADQALSWRPEWKVPVYPDGDYYAFLTTTSQREHSVTSGSKL